MTARFLKLIPWLWRWECVLDKKGNVVAENDPDDPGGLTKYGIDQRSHPDVDIRNLTDAKAKELYWFEYWQRHGCNNLPPPFDYVWFNCCVNCGRGRADKLRARSGLDALKFLDEQEAFYHRLAEHKPTLKKFLKGWLNRTADLRRFITP